MRYDARNIDSGVRSAVALLNDIPGVTTRASCEGVGTDTARHRHATLAYIALRHPMPLQLQDFLINRLGTLARIEEDGIFCRWPHHNRVFIGSLETAARRYLDGSIRGHSRSIRWPLARLRGRIARLAARGAPVQIGLCLACTALVSDPHPDSHGRIVLLQLAADLQEQWFAEFAGQAEAALDAALVATEGWVRLLARTQRGDFGAAYLRRWLRHRARMVARLTTRQLRHGVEAARRNGLPLDFFHDGTHAVFVWSGAER